MHLKAVNVGIVLCLPLWLSSCSRTPPVPQQVVMLPPESVFTPCEHPQLQGRTWGDTVGGLRAETTNSAQHMCWTDLDFKYVAFKFNS
ncbi:Rz1-like lysis system protein LysC [Serratia marcescens]|uniref:Rz1-like lysis system protein LysC n=2 Tax=Serratia TaxID=613 RepID=UPI003F80623F